MFKVLSIDLPKRFFPLVNRRTILARFLARLVSVVTLEFRLCKAASLRQRSFFLGNSGNIDIDTFVLDVPISHLLKKLALVILVFSPTHMENGRLLLPSDEISHEFLALMKMKSTRELLAKLRVVPSKDLDL